MKYILIILFPVLLIAQDNIDPLPIISDTTENYDIIVPEQQDFILGWNWGTAGKKLDDALNVNFYHSYPNDGSESEEDYADNIRIILNLNVS